MGVQIVFFVPGVPAPQGSKRHIGNGRMIESASKKLAPWRRSVVLCTRNAMNARSQATDLWAGKVPGQPIHVTMDFALPRPRAHYATGRNAGELRTSAALAVPAGYPDLDKLVRAVLDGLKLGGLLADDGQAVALSASKRYVHVRENPGCRIIAEEWDGLRLGERR
jgi:crossover junction endodeoxyribonuclease RusA